jgi:hypothetical protein
MGIPRYVSLESIKGRAHTRLKFRKELSTVGGMLEHAQQIANHESPRTTKLYDRTSDAISLDEIERIVL